MKSGTFFGEYSLITQQPRSASVRPKSYAMVGKVGKEKFDEMLYMFPELRQKFKNHLFSYQDKYKKWIKQQMRNILYLKYLPENVTDEFIIIMQKEFL